jgi:protein O-GlcNAc transferase
VEEAAHFFAQALNLDSKNLLAASGRLFNRMYHPHESPGDLLADARLFAERHERPLTQHQHQRAQPRDPHKRLKIGYVSADFRAHSVAYFIEPILARHDHDQVEVYCYYTGAMDDTVTQRLAKLADHWITARGLSDAMLAERVRSDDIDILVDLAGHTGGNKLLVFARKPAPIQITWIGYLGTTGLRSMDYRMTDVIADPPGSGDDAHSERLIRLPRTCLCYRPPSDAPPVAALPALANGFVTFGSFNAPAKHNSRVLDVWASILRAVPGSRLLLKGRGLDRGKLRSGTLAVFEKAGIATERVRLQSYDSDVNDHLSRYAEIDIGLDPFPYNGVTTTCEALWMGVPVVGLRGNRHSARMCASLLTNAGLAQCVAETCADYEALAKALAYDLPRLVALRRGLRDGVRQSALTDERGVARDVEAAFRAVWQALSA